MQKNEKGIGEIDMKNFLIFLTSISILIIVLMYITNNERLRKIYIPLVENNEKLTNTIGQIKKVEKSIFEEVDAEKNIRLKIITSQKEYLVKINIDNENEYEIMEEK